MSTLPCRSYFRRSIRSFTPPGLGLLLLVAAAGCGELPAEDQEGDLEGAEIIEGDLIAPPDGHVRFWPNGVVKICVPIDHVRSRAELSAVREADAEIRAALAGSWGAAARISFESCPAPTASNEERVILKLEQRAHWGGIGGVAGLGAMKTNIVRLGYCAPHMPGSNCSRTDSGTFVDHKEWLRATAIHEFGHVLGFAHEHQQAVPRAVSHWCADAREPGRTDNPSNNGIVKDARYLSDFYDRASIMNYCRDQDNNGRKDEVWDSVLDRLSPLDIQGVARAYGRR